MQKAIITLILLPSLILLFVLFAIRGITIGGLMDIDEVWEGFEMYLFQYRWLLEPFMLAVSFVLYVLALTLI